MAEDPKPDETKEKDTWLPKNLLREMKSFADKEGKQMVGFMRDTIRNVVNPDEEPSAGGEAEKPAEPSDWALPVRLTELLEAASEATGKTPAQLMAACISRSLEDVIRDEEARRAAAKAKLDELRQGGD
jgi:predicted DNA-binding protein